MSLAIATLRALGSPFPRERALIARWTGYYIRTLPAGRKAAIGASLVASSLCFFHSIRSSGMASMAWPLRLVPVQPPRWLPACTYVCMGMADRHAKLSTKSCRSSKHAMHEERLPVNRATEPCGGEIPTRCYDPKKST